MHMHTQRTNVPNHSCLVHVPCCPQANGSIGATTMRERERESQRAHDNITHPLIPPRSATATTYLTCPLNTIPEAIFAAMGAMQSSGAGNRCAYTVPTWPIMSPSANLVVPPPPTRTVHTR